MVSAAEPMYGPALIGVFISLILYGIILCQTFMYYRSYQTDTKRLKAFVAFLVFTDTFHSMFSMALIYKILITHYNDPSVLAESQWLFNAYPALVGMISCSVQLFFAWRVRVLTGNNWLFGGICLICLANFAAGLSISIEAGMGKIFQHIADFKRLVLIWLLISMVAEISLTLVLTWFLRKPTLFLGSSNDLVRRIARLTLSNGLITTLWTLGDIICYFEQTAIGTHLIFCYPLAKWYIITMLSTLNARPTFAERQLQPQAPVKLVDSQRTSLFNPLQPLRRRANSYSAAESQTPTFSITPFMTSRPTSSRSDEKMEMEMRTSF